MRLQDAPEAQLARRTEADGAESEHEDVRSRVVQALAEPPTPTPHCLRLRLQDANPVPMLLGVSACPPTVAMVEVAPSMG